MVRYHQQHILFFYIREGLIKFISTDEGETWSSGKLLQEMGGRAIENLRNGFDVSINSDGSYLIFAEPFENGTIIPQPGPLTVWKFSSSDE
ncbi:MAG: hypothetical protein U5K00_17950 [Melioribacteraceae bacterium]|nr:hypothetical protein [Melioribacteraceae bacterium]